MINVGVCQLKVSVRSRLWVTILWCATYQCVIFFLLFFLLMFVCSLFACCSLYKLEAAFQNNNFIYDYYCVSSVIIVPMIVYSICQLIYGTMEPLSTYNRSIYYDVSAHQRPMLTQLLCAKNIECFHRTIRSDPIRSIHTYYLHSIE